jgi:hypothetical protein
MHDDDFNGRYILDEQGNPMPCVGLMEWAMWFETAGAQRRVARDLIDGHLISTIFLGLDQNIGASATDDPLHYRPVLWETMAWNEIGEQTFQRRYRSREDALAGHAETVAWVRRNLALQESQLKEMMMEISESLPVNSPLTPGEKSGTCDSESVTGQAGQSEKES